MNEFWIDFIKTDELSIISHQISTINMMMMIMIIIKPIYFISINDVLQYFHSFFTLLNPSVLAAKWSNKISEYNQYITTAAAVVAQNSKIRK